MPRPEIVGTTIPVVSTFAEVLASDQYYTAPVTYSLGESYGSIYYSRI